MLNKLIRLFAISILLIGLISCNDDPTSLGSNILPNKDLINVSQINSLDSVFQQKARFYNSDTLDLSSSTKIFLGKNGNVESTMLMEFLFFFPDSIKEAILGDSLIVKSVVMELEPIYTKGNASNYFNFSVHEITSDWNSLDFSVEDLSSLQYNPEDISSNHILSGDTLITIDIDKNVVTDWLKLYANETQETNYGVYFNFENATDKILGFPAISSLYDSVLTRLKIVVEVPNYYTDTLTAQVTSDAHVVKGELPTTNNHSIIIQGGIPIHSNLFIDVSKIPQYSIINKATLKLFIDESESEIGTIASDYIKVALLDDYESSKVSTFYSALNLELDSLFYSGEITTYVQEWITNGNNGMKLYLSNEVESLNKVAISGTDNSDVKLRPYLEIIYTSKN
ncbi:MAG: hypothetical protein KKF62_00450 [Bacteroidetes bacterium]|nr:hypothetical protein [Bacteroidota bacterium]MBU1113866.1 hypothetical protein [Bacteroidota bacterium]MBU1798108.1 hypothetical protein [Bacteroidota bacterium]